MIETTVPIKIQPGLFTNGTMLDREGRWAGGNLVRFPNGYPEAMGTWATLSLSATPPGGAPCGAFTWYSQETIPKQYVACATDTPKLFVIKHNTAAPHTMTNITAVGMAGGGSSFLQAFSFAALNGVLLISRAAGVGDHLFSWDPIAGGVATAVAGAPTTKGVFVTAEQFAVVIESNGQDISWPSQGGVSTWTPATTNSAGGLTLPGTSPALCGVPVRGQNLILTEDDVWAFDYIGAPLYYGLTRVGPGSGAIGPNVVSVVGSTAYWMGFGGFFKYDGYVQPIACDIADTVFSTSLPRVFGPRFFSLVNPQTNEIWWYYCSTSSATTPDKVASYNYTNQTWSLGTLSRAAGCDGLWHDAISNEQLSPILFDPNGTTVYQHESGGGAAAGAYVESGPSFINDGDQTALVQKIIPDGAVTGDSITLFSGTDPGVAEVTNGPSSVTAGTRIDTRFRARYVRFKQTLTTAASRVGVPKLGVIPSSKR